MQTEGSLFLYKFTLKTINLVVMIYRYEKWKMKKMKNILL